MRKKLKKNGYGILSVFSIVTVFGTYYQMQDSKRFWDIYSKRDGK